MRIKDISKDNRPRERLLYQGPEVLSDAELLAIILQSGYKGENVIDLSNRIISNNYGSIRELTKIKGIGEAKASRIIAMFELMKRQKAGSIREKVVTCAEDIAKYYMEKMKDFKREHLIAVFLDSKNKIICDKVISIGTLNASLVHPREVFREAIKVAANALILVHNHPSGDCEASEEDEMVTDRIRNAGEMLNIKLLDHVVVGKEDYKTLPK